MVRSLYKSVEDSPGGAKELFMMVQAWALIKRQKSS